MMDEIPKEACHFRWGMLMNAQCRRPPFDNKERPPASKVYTVSAANGGSVMSKEFTRVALLLSTLMAAGCASTPPLRAPICDTLTMAGVLSSRAGPAGRCPDRATAARPASAWLRPDTRGTATVARHRCGRGADRLPSGTPDRARRRRPLRPLCGALLWLQRRPCVWVPRLSGWLPRLSGICVLRHSLQRAWRESWRPPRRRSSRWQAPLSLSVRAHKRPERQATRSPIQAERPRGPLALDARARLSRWRYARGLLAVSSDGFAAMRQPASISRVGR